MEQEKRRKKLYSLLGELPERNRPISATKNDEREHDGYILEKLTLDLNGIEAVPAYFARPKELSGKTLTVLYNHAHGGDYLLGKEEFIDRNSPESPPPGWIGLLSFLPVLKADRRLQPDLWSPDSIGTTSRTSGRKVFDARGRSRYAMTPRCRIAPR